LKLPAQELEPSEADAFLEYVFSMIATRPKALSLRQGAGVASYLKTLAWKVEPGPRRYLLDRLADVIWGTLFQCAPLPSSERQEVINFLRQHADTYLSAFDIETTVKWVQESPGPSQQALSAHPPPLMSRRSSAVGAGNPQLKEDLSERIYAAYHALRAVPVHNARGRIAKVLNQKGLTTHARGGGFKKWGSYEVYERAKQYEAAVEAKLKRLLAKQQAEAPLPASHAARLAKQIPDQARGLAHSTVDKWVYLFHSSQHQEVPKRPDGTYQFPG
jgi:hypothetical protein